MYFIQNVLISDEVMEANFHCDVAVCKGACCWEGDFGAPLEEHEIDILSNILEDIKPYLSPAGIEVLEAVGPAIYYDDMQKMGTPLYNGGPCAYLSIDQNGIAQCGIERAWADGKTTYQKPISCHLYPLRILATGTDMEAINYDQWSICAPACKKGNAEQVSLVRFAKDALIRKYGVSFYEELEAAADRHLEIQAGQLKP
jgi:hypothetical protein